MPAPDPALDAFRSNVPAVKRSDASDALVRLLWEPLGDGRRFGYRLANAASTDALELVCEKDGRSFVAWVRAASPETRAFRRTRSCALGHRGEPPDADGLRLLEALADVVGRDEERIAALLPRAPAVSRATFFAVKAGVKPAMRQIVPEDAVGPMLANAKDAGLEARVLRAPEYIAHLSAARFEPSAVLVFLAREAAAAEEAAKVEERQVRLFLREQKLLQGGPVSKARGLFRALFARPRWREVTFANARVLGYPPCCAAFFWKSRHRPNAELRALALARTRGAPELLLNNLDFTQAIVAHFVCAYDCAPSLAYARDALAAYEREVPDEAKAVVARLRETLARVGEPTEAERAFLSSRRK